MRAWYKRYLNWSNSPHKKEGFWFGTPDVSRQVAFMEKIGWFKLIGIK